MKSNSAATVLTIAIPTYNRAAKLQAQLDRLLPQLTPDVQLCVFDNASTDNTRAVVELFLSKGVFYRCAAFNGGFGRNFLRCFEECQSAWLWILSDDDPVLPDAVEKLLQNVKNCTADFVHTSSQICRHDTEKYVNNIPDLLRCATFNSLLWISTGIYRVSAFRPFLGVFTESISTWGPHFVTLLTWLERQGGKVFISPIQLIVHSGKTEWSSLDCVIRFSHIPEYLKKPYNQSSIAQCIWQEVYYWALLLGLREITGSESIHRWQRIRQSARQNLSAYGAKSPLREILLKKWYKKGQRKTSLLVFHQVMIITILAWCPPRIFPMLIRRMPRPSDPCLDFLDEM